MKSNMIKHDNAINYLDPTELLDTDKKYFRL